MNKESNNKGFTMIEMLAVFVILAVLAMIAVPTISSMIKKTRSEYYKTLEGNIKIAGIDYFGVHTGERPKYNLSTRDVSLDVLEENKYFNEKIVDASGNSTCSGYVRALKEKEGKYSYTTCLVCKDYKSSALYCDEDYDPKANKGIYRLKAPKTVYSYLGKEIDVNKLEKAKLYAREKPVGTVTALASSVKDVDINQVGKYEIKYQVEVEGKTITTTSNLQIYQNEAPRVTLTKNVGVTPTVYLSNTWTNQNVQETVTVDEYVHGTMKEVQYYDEKAGGWKTLSLDNSYKMNHTCKDNQTCVINQKIRSVDTEGNISKERETIIKIDKIKPTCEMKVVDGRKGENNFYISQITIGLETEDKDSGINSLGTQIEDSVDNSHVNSNAYMTRNEGTHTIRGMVADNAGNVNTCQLNDIKIDTTPPSIKTLSIATGVSGYNSLSTSISIDATDANGLGNMYLSQTEYEQDGSWESYKTTKNYSLTGKLDGTNRTIYLSLKDKAGNIVRKMIDYTVYKECSQTTTKWGGWSSCSKACGTGTQSRTGTKYDKFTKVNCGSDSGSQECNTRACCSSTRVGSYGPWGSCSAQCGGGYQYRNVYLVSTYDGSSCGSRQESQSCNTQVCPHTHVYGKSLNSISGTYLNYKITTYHWNGTWTCTRGHKHTAKKTLRAYKQQCIICGAEGDSYWCPCSLDKQSGCP